MNINTVVRLFISLESQALQTSAVEMFRSDKKYNEFLSNIHRNVAADIPIYHRISLIKKTRKIRNLHLKLLFGHKHNWSYTRSI